MSLGRALVRLCSVVLLFCVVLLGGVNCGDSETASSPVLDVTPTTLSLVVGASAALKATRTADGATQDVTNTATWSSGAPNVASVTGGKVVAVAVGSATISVTSEALTKTVSVTVTVTATDKPLVSLSVAPAPLTIAKGFKKQLVATGTYADGSTANVSSQAAWSSATSSVATVDAAGLLTSLAAGTSKITATIGAIAGSTEVTVTAATLASIAVTPPNPSVFAGASQAFIATGTMTDNTTNDLTTQATWTSSAPIVATIANTGTAKGVSTGTSTITATFNGLSGSTLLTVTQASATTLVSITLEPKTASVAVGIYPQQFFATGTFGDGSEQEITETVTWTSSDPTCATISNEAGSQGAATGIAQGTAVITAFSGAITGSATLTVRAAEVVSISVTPSPARAAIGATVQFTATGRYSDESRKSITSLVTWSSNNAAVAPISDTGSGKGRATAVSAGRATISAKLDGVTGSTALTVEP